MKQSYLEKNRYQPNLALADHLRILLVKGKEYLQPYIFEVVKDFSLRNSIKGKIYLRHDFMDHSIALVKPLDNNPIHEVFADLVQNAAETVMKGEKQHFSFDFVDECILWRDKYDILFEKLDYIYEYSPLVYSSGFQFYSYLGQKDTKQIWELCDYFYRELNGMEYSNKELSKFFSYP